MLTLREQHSYRLNSEDSEVDIMMPCRAGAGRDL